MANLCLGCEQRVLDRLEALRLLRWEAGLPASDPQGLLEEALDLGLALMLGEQLAHGTSRSRRTQPLPARGREGRA